MNTRMTCSKTDVRVVFVCVMLLIVPAFITLNTVKHPAQFEVVSDPTPYGYTWSLIMFLLPVLCLGWWFRFKYTTRTNIDNKAVGFTIMMFTLAGFTLDIVFGNTFFRFPNHAATLQVNLPGYVWGEGWQVSLPIEEFFFYYLGALFMLLMYIWSDVYWLGLYKVEKTHGISRSKIHLRQLHRPSLLIGVTLVLGGILFKYFGPHPYHDGFPAYWTLLIVCAVTPSCLFFPTIKDVVNWRAFMFTLFVLLLLSVMWEVTLAIPYKWWSYNERWMTGMAIGAWANLPLEAILMWFAAAWGMVILFELSRIHFAKKMLSKTSLEQQYTSNDTTIYREKGYENGASVIPKILHSEYPTPHEIALLTCGYEIAKRLIAMEIIQPLELIKEQHHPATVFGGDANLLLDAILSQPFDMRTFLGNNPHVLTSLHQPHVIHKHMSLVDVVRSVENQAHLIDFGTLSLLRNENLGIHNLN